MITVDKQLNGVKMKLYKNKEEYQLWQGSMLDMEQVVYPESVDAIITDPPYELGFMGKTWDSTGVAFNKDTWSKCLNALKPGGYLLAFGGSRTYHRIACAIEDAGFEIRDTIMWLYGSGFPKSMNIGLAIDKKNGIESIDTGEKINSMNSLGIMHDDNWKSAKDITRKKATNEWEGWGTALKPSYEPIIVARKPFKGTLVDNVMQYGVGGLNIEECRVGNEVISIHNAPVGTFAGGEYNRGSDTDSYRESTGRFPANTILTYDETDYKEVCSGFPYTKGTGEKRKRKGQDSTCYGKYNATTDTSNSCWGDEGSASRYFYCAKASKKDRDEGLSDFETKTKVFNGKSSESSKDIKDVEKRFTTEGKNIHPTVKPTELMQYLVRLVAPKGAVIMDCFNGSGSTGKAVMYENLERSSGYKYIGIEMTEEYLPISAARIDYVINKKKEIQKQHKESWEQLMIQLP